MSCTSAGRRSRQILVGFLAAFLLVLTSTGVYAAAKGRELIVVIDVSTSMADIFETARSEAKQFISSAQLGDRVTLITFGESSHLLERARIKSSYDIARILSKIEELEPTEYASNLPLGMERGLKEMQQFYEDHPEGQRVLLWLSDDKNNPPKDIPNLITFSTLKQREADRLPDHNWFVFEAPIEPEAESDVKWFVDWATRTKMQLRVTPLSDDLGTIFASTTEGEFRVRFEPDTQAVWGTSFSVVAEVKELSGRNYSATVPVTPPIIVCGGRTWDQTFHVALPDRPGEYECRISFVLPSDKLLEISPPQAIMRARVQPEMETVGTRVAAVDEIVSEDSEGRERPSRKRPATRTAFSPEIRGKLGEGARRPGTTSNLVFGPIVAGGQYRESISLFPSKNIPLESIHMKTNFELPDGLELQPSYAVSEGTLVADLCLTAGDNPKLSDGWEMRGTIFFLSNENGVSINPGKIQARFYSKNVMARWGRRELAATGAYEQFANIVGGAISYALTAVKVLMVILAVWLVYRLVIRYAFASTELVGTLEIVKCPADRKKRLFNLPRLGRLKRTGSITIGSSGKADIVLAHPSVADIHAKITTARTDAGVIVFVQPVPLKHILVNDVAYSRQKEIGDQDILGIGEFALLYARPELYRETIVRFADGRAVRGSLVSWDIDSTSFEFLPKGAPSLDTRMLVEFSELKTVSFIRKEARFSASRFLGSENLSAGRPVEIFFKDGELLEGSIVGESGEWSKRFYLIPKERGEAALILVEHSAVQNIFPREVSKEPLFRIRRALRSLTGQTRH